MVVLRRWWWWYVRVLFVLMFVSGVVCGGDGWGKCDARRILAVW